MTTNPIDPQQHAEALAAGLEGFAAFLRANPDMAGEFTYSLSNIMEPVTTHSDPRALLAEYARAAKNAGATIRKHIDPANLKYADVTAAFGPVQVAMTAESSKVCERVLTGSREVEISEPDPEALAAVPQITKTVTVDEYQWRCTPLLAPAEQDKAVSA